ncbi:MAG: ribosome recycling factor [Spirochaetota bacterium]
MSDYSSQASVKMEKTIEVLKKDFSQVRTGKANPAMIEDVKVEYYGAMTSLNQMGTITTPEPRLLAIAPFDKSAIKNIEKAIMASNLGFTPVNDGTIIRITLPELTGERRRELVKVVKQKAEDKKVAIRNIRREVLDDIKKNSELSKDEAKSFGDDIQKVTDSFVNKISQLTEAKEKEITTV